MAKANVGKLLKIRWSRRRIIKLLLALVVAGTLAFLVWQYLELRKENQRLADPQAAAQEETRRLVDEVGKSLQLPENEVPTVATVVDASKLKSQAFFARSENGDRVLIYTQAKKAILYRPSTRKIIEVAPINIGNNGSAEGQQPPQQ